jgi:hypothetical protein
MANSRWRALLSQCAGLVRGTCLMPVTERTRARPSVGITTPALTRHIVVFFPALAASTGLPPIDDDPLSATRAEDLLIRYVTSLLKIAVDHGALRDADYKYECEKLKAALKAHANFAVYCGTFLGFRLRVITILYTEYFALTYILENDSSGTSSRPFQSQSLRTIRELAAYFRDKLSGPSPTGTPASGASNTRHEIDVSPSYKWPHAGSPNQTSDEFLNDIIYREVWSALSKTLNNDPYIREIGTTAFKNDLRGLLLTASSSNPVLDEAIFAEIQCTEPAAVSSPIKARQKPCITDYLQNESSFLSTTLCLETSQHRYAGKQPDVRWDPNHVLCFLSDKAAIYGSCLVYCDNQRGPMDDLLQTNNDYTRFFIVYEGTNAYTLGRLVRRLHVLAELRVMALIERSQITGLSDCLRLLGQELSSVIDQMTGRHSEPTRKPETLNIDSLSRIIDAYNDIGRSRDVTDTEGKKPNGGLSYRISRSKFYYEALKPRLDDLHCEDIKGAQSYVRFVSRNYAQQIQAIESIGDRHTILGTRIDRAITISHSLVQRKFAQYALNVALCVAGIPTFVAINTALSLTNQTFISRKLDSLIVLAIIIAGIVALSWVFKLFLQDKGLYVKIERTSQNDKPH